MNDFTIVHVQNVVIIVNYIMTSTQYIRDIVKASHLQPLERKDITNGDRKQPWNISCSSMIYSDEITDKLTEGCGPPTNAQELIRQWRRYRDNPQEQYK